MSKNFKFLISNFKDKLSVCPLFLGAAIGLQSCSTSMQDQSMQINSKQNQEVVREIEEILTQANAMKEKDIKEAANHLLKAKDKLPDLQFPDENIPQNGDASRPGATITDTQESAYFSRFGNISYHIGDYETAAKAYKDLTEILSGSFKAHKARGDALRKCGKIYSSIDSYDKALKLCKDNCDSNEQDKNAKASIAAILNNRGLAYLEVGKYEEAVDDFSEAIKLVEDDALYRCNLGGALYALGKAEEGIKSFKSAQELINGNILSGELTKNNISFIRKMLANFLPELKQIYEEVLQNPDSFDDITLRRAKDLGIILVTRLIDNTNNQIEALFKRFESSKDYVKHIKSKKGEARKPYYYYEGFCYKMNQAYNVAVAVDSGTFELKTGGTGVTVASKLASLIPYAGDTLATLIKSGAELVQEAKIKKAATNVAKLATNQSEFSYLAQDICCDLVQKNENEILSIDPKPFILPKWANRFECLAKMLNYNYDNLNRAIYGERNEDDIQRLGSKNASELIEKFIASGKIYEERRAIDMSDEDKISKCVCHAKEIFGEDVKASNDKKIFNHNKMPKGGCFDDNCIVM